MRSPYFSLFSRITKWQTRCSVCAGVLVAVATKGSEPERGDFWLDASLGFRVGAASQTVREARPDPLVASDFAKKTTGDCSVRVAFRDAKIDDAALLMVPGPYRPHWLLSPDWRLEFDFCQQGANPPATCKLTLVDGSGRSAEGVEFSIPVDGEWRRISVLLSGLIPSTSFDFGDVARVQLTFSGRPENVWLDAVRFSGAGDQEIALTDLRTEQRIAEEKATRPARIEEAMQAMIAAGSGAGGQGLFYYAVPNRDTNEPNLQRLFANLQLNRDIDQTNRELLAIYSSTDPKLRADYGLEYTWDLLATPTLCRFLLNFGQHSRRHPGRLSPKVEKVMLELLWERTQFKNDIHIARQSTWNLTGSENHDLNAKVGNVISSQIFLHEPEFAERAYPDRGSGPGYGYWFHKTKQAGRFHGPEGTAPRAPAGTGRAQEHYVAWVGFMKQYLRERAAHGFFLEKASPTYMRYTVSFIQDLHDYVEDPELKKLSGMFLDLIWAEWAQDQIAGGRGGAKTRDHGPITDLRQDAMYQMATFVFGGPARFNPALGSFWLTDYRPPEVVWNLVLNRSALGSFAYISRTPGEETGVLPRPPGMERTLVCAPDSRLKRYSWVTPDYILGTQMDHPLAIHSHLSPAARAEGIQFATSPQAMVFPRNIEQIPQGKWKIGRDSLYRSVQQGPVLITQQARAFAAVSPEWFPGQSHDSHPYGLYFSPALNRVQEDRGWIFVEEGNAYVAIRVVKGVYQMSVDSELSNYDWLDYDATAEMQEPLEETPYTWNSDHTLLRCADRHSPIIFEAGRRADFATLDEFKRHIFGNRVALTKTTVPGWYFLTYTSNGTTFYFNAANSEIPKIGGRSIDYAPVCTFDSPFLTSEYGSGVVKITDRTTSLVLDFPHATASSDRQP